MNIFERPKKESNTPSTLHSEHLNEGVKPLIASIVNKDEVDSITQKTIEDIEQNGANVLYGPRNDVHEKNNMINLEEKIPHHSCILSDVDSADKFSEGFYNCTGLMVTGTEKTTGKEISLLTHMDPSYFLANKEVLEDLEESLTKQLETLKERSLPNTIDAVIAAGQHVKSVWKNKKKEYVSSIEEVGGIVEKVLGFTPVVHEPKLEVGDGTTRLYVDTQKRRIFLIQKHNDIGNREAFNAKDLNKVRKKWKK